MTTPAHPPSGLPGELARTGTVIVAIVLLALTLARHEAPGEQAPGQGGASRDAALARVEHAIVAATEERGRAYLLLHRIEPWTASQAATVAHDQDRARATLGEALLTLIEAEGERVRAPVRRVRDAGERIDALRAQVASAGASAGTRRAHDLAERWLRAQTALVDRLLVVARDLRARRADARASDHAAAALQDHVWRVAALAGLQRALIGAVIEGRRASADHYARFADYRRRMHLEWDRVRHVAGVGGLEAALAPELRAVEDGLLGGVARTQDRVLEAASRASPAPLSAQDWFDQASRGIATVLAVAVRADSLAAGADPAPEPRGAIDA